MKPEILTLAAALIAGPAFADTIDIDIRTFQFGPNEITVKLGDTVRWTNFDGIEHSATSIDRADDGTPVFDTGLFEKGEAREVVMTQAGTFAYFCARHPSMTGQLVVTTE